MRLNRLTTLAICAATLTIISAPLLAQETATTKVKKQIAGAEEIVVTARKREESLQEVPLSITAFTAEQLRKKGAFSNDDVALLTVNFNTVAQVGRRNDRPTIRGQSAPAIGGEPNASYFIDGTFVSGSISTTTLGPIERVEILRGPQSAQFGRATFAGAVNYVTRKPSNEFTGEVQAKAGNDETRRLSAWASGPIAEDKLLYFVAAGWDHYGGEWKNQLKANQAPPLNFINPAQMGDSSDLGGTDTKDIVGKLLWTPTDTAEVTLKLGYTKGDDDHYVQLIQEAGELNCYLPTNGAGNTQDNSGESWYETSRGSYCGTFDIGSVNYNSANPFDPRSSNPVFEPLYYLQIGTERTPIPNQALIDNLPAQGGPRQSRYNLPDFYNGMELPDFSPFLPNTEPEDWIATPEKPGTRREQKRFLLNYVQGIDDWNLTTRLTHNRDVLDQGFDLDRTQQRFFGGSFTMFEHLELKDSSAEIRVDSPAEGPLSGSLGLYYFKSDSDSFQKRFVSEGAGQFPDDPMVREIENKAFFGSLNYQINNYWSLSAEARISRDEKSINSGVSCSEISSDFFGEPLANKQSARSFTPRLTARYLHSDETMLYALIAKGNKPAGFNRTFFRAATADPCETLGYINNPGDDITTMDEEDAITYELGAKTTWLDSRILTNLSLFYIDWENQSVYQTDGLIQYNDNAGKSEVFGLELETAFVITDNLTGQFSYGLADGKFVEYTDDFFAKNTGIGLNPDGTVDPASNNVKGHRFPSTPKHSFVTALSYTRGISADMDWFAHTDFILETGRYTSADNFIKIPTRKLWNVRTGFDRPEWTLTAYVNNILDENTPTSVFGFQYIQGLKWDQTRGNVRNPNDPYRFANGLRKR